MKKRLSRQPKGVRYRNAKMLCDDRVWWYEERGGICIFISREPGKVDQRWIPIGQLRKYIERHDSARDGEG